MPSEGDRHEHLNREFSDHLYYAYVRKPLLLNLEI